jgi:outer membrane protein, heavy metal efflux system
MDDMKTESLVPRNEFLEAEKPHRNQGIPKLTQRVDVLEFKESSARMRAQGRFAWGCFCAGVAIVLAGCATSGERRAWQELEQTQRVDQSTLGASLQPADVVHGERLTDYLQHVMRHNPRLLAAFNEWKAALERIPQARALPDPELSFGYFISQIDTRADPRGEAYGLSQMFPWFGKLKLSGDVALEAALAAGQRYEAERLELFERVANEYYEYYYAHRSIEVAEANLELANHLVEIARARFRTDAGAHVDVIRAQVELGRADDRLRSLRDIEGSVRANLNAALGRPAEAALSGAPVRGDLEFERGLIEAPDQEWIVRAREENPELLALQHEAASRENSVRLARRNYFPDLRFGIEYSRNIEARMARMDAGGRDMLMGTVMVNLPIWPEKYGSAIREARAMRDAAELTLEDRRLQVEASLKRALYEFRDAERRIDLYANTLLPMARQSLQVSETTYRAADGRGSFLEVIEAQRVLLEFELAHERALTDRFQRLGEIQRLIGGFIRRGSVEAGRKFDE